MREAQDTNPLLGSGLFSETLHSVAVREPTPQTGSIMVPAIIILLPYLAQLGSVDHHLRRESVYKKLIVMLSSQKA